MDELELFFAGTGASVPAARRGLPALLARLDGDRLLFDCGEGTQRQLLRSVGLPDLDAVFLTHHHADHWLGLPGMLKTFDLRGREKPLDVFGPPGTQRLLASLSGVWGRVAYDLQVTDIDAGDAIEFDGYEVEAFNVRHRGRAFGYALVEHERPGPLRPRARRGARRRARARPSAACRRGRPSTACSPEQVIGEARPGPPGRPLRRHGAVRHGPRVGARRRRAGPRGDVPRGGRRPRRGDRPQHRAPGRRGRARGGRRACSC